MAFLELRLTVERMGPGTDLSGAAIRKDQTHFIIGDPSSALYARIRKRSAYPGTYCIKNQDGILLGYGNPEPRGDDEFLQIFISWTGSVWIQRDVAATLPLFYGQRDSDSTFTISNDYKFVCDSLQYLTPSRKGILESLMIYSDHTNTLWEQIYRLPAVHMLERDTDGNIRVEVAPSKQWRLSGDAPRTDPHDFASYFSQHMDKFVERFSAQHTGFVISGGLDSATLPLYLARKGNSLQAFPAVSLAYPGEFGARQDKKLQTVEAFTGLGIQRIPLDTNEPAFLREDTNQGVHGRHFHHLQNPYIYTEVPMVNFLEQSGVDVLFTGVGGDDIMENTVETLPYLEWGQEAYANRLRRQYSPYLTQKAAADFAAFAPVSAPVPLPLPDSIYLATNRMNNAFIEHGIWPVSPFIDRNLYEYCQGLPAHFRENKNILRLFHQSYHLPPDLYAASENEHFGPYLEKMLLDDSFRKLVHDYAEQSITADLGYVDPIKLIAEYESAWQRKQLPDDLISLVFWLPLEINMHAGSEH